MNDEHVSYPVRIVIDANTLISATLTPGITREMLLTTEDELYSPAFIRDELDKHRAVLRDKSGLADADLDTRYSPFRTTVASTTATDILIIQNRRRVSTVIGIEIGP